MCSWVVRPACLECDFQVLSAYSLLLLLHPGYLCRYLSLHFGPLEVAFANFLAETGILADGLDFPKKCGDLVMSWAAKQGAATGRALDLGCAVGR